MILPPIVFPDSAQSRGAPKRLEIIIFLITKFIFSPSGDDTAVTDETGRRMCQIRQADDVDVFTKNEGLGEVNDSEVVMKVLAVEQVSML